MLTAAAWYLLLMLTGWMVLPVTRRFFSSLPDKGYTLSKPVGLLLWGFCFWLLASLGLLNNNAGGALFALLLAAGVSLTLGGGWKGAQDSFRWVRSRLGLVLTSEALFLGAFVFLALMRAANPQVSGTEKPMEMAFINAILRSPTFPPHDPWLSGYAISYYYFGYVMVALLIRLAGASAGVGFNLAVASWFALAAVGSYGLVHNLLSAANRRRKDGEHALINPDKQALLAPLMLLIVSNLGGLLEVLHASGQFWQKTASGWSSAFWSWLAIPELINPPVEPFGWIPERFGGIWWWRASRVVQDFDISGGWREVIDEFPFFSYYLADLHPHVLSMPFVLLVIGLGLNLFLRGEKTSFAGFALKEWVRTADFWFAALALGGLAFLNTWDFPIYVALFSAAVVLVRAQQLGWQWWARLKDLAGCAIALGAAGILMYFPFYLGFSSQAGGVLPSLAFYTRGIHFWIMFAPLLVPVVLWLGWRWLEKRDWHNLKKGLQAAGLALALLWVFSYLLGALGLFLPVLGRSLASSTTPAMAALGQKMSEWGGLFFSLQGSADANQIFFGSLRARLVNPGTWLSLVVVIAMVWGWLAETVKPASRTPDTAPADQEGSTPTALPVMQAEWYVLLLVLVAAALTLAVEFVYLRDQFGTRMNTIFKFYFQAWMLWSLVASYALVVMWRDVRHAWGWVVRGLAALVVACGLIYPFFAVTETLNFSNTDGWTLDGNAWFGAYYPDEQGAVAWLQRAPFGIIAEAVGGSYTGAARMATYSGLPNVLGWPGHESQWRGGGEEMGSRMDDLARLYRTTNWPEAQAILKQYNIRYVVVGGLERSQYKVSETKFQEYLNRVFQAGSVVIYEVID